MKLHPQINNNDTVLPANERRNVAFCINSVINGDVICIWGKRWHLCTMQHPPSAAEEYDESVGGRRADGEYLLPNRRQDPASCSCYKVLKSAPTGFYTKWLSSVLLTQLFPLSITVLGLRLPSAHSQSREAHSVNYVREQCHTII